MDVRLVRENITRHLFEVNEENIVIRGEAPSNSFLQICRVTDKKLAKDKKLVGNALYITDSGKMFITDFNGVRINLKNSIEKTDGTKIYTQTSAPTGVATGTVWINI